MGTVRASLFFERYSRSIREAKWNRVRFIGGSGQRYNMVDGPKYLVAGAIGFAGERAKFGARMTAPEPPITVLLTVHGVMRKAVSTVRARFGLLRA